MTDARSDILGRIRRVHQTPLPQHEISEALTELGIAPPAPGIEDSPLQHLQAQLKDNHISVEHAANRAEAVQHIAHYVYQSYRNYRIVAGNDPRLAAMPWRDRGVLVRFDAAAAQDLVSVSYALLGVAESGSMALFSNRHNPGANNWLAQDHIIV